MRFSSQTFWFANLNRQAYNAGMHGIFIVFSLLSALRHGTPTSQLWRVFQNLDQSLSPKTSFWLALCRQANLINHHEHPAALAQDWLTWPVDAQILHLFDAWEKAPLNRKERMLRWRLRLRLAQGRDLRPSDARLLPGLDALGITHQKSLTLLGKAVLGLAGFPSPAPRLKWWLDEHILHVPHDPDWSLLWQLEAYLTPCASFTYSLDALSLRRASQRGEADRLLEILQKGLGSPVPPEIRAHILGQPVMKATSGLVLEFSDPAELRQLRRSEPLRGHFERVLSPRHVLVEEQNAQRLLKLLERRGIHASSTLPVDGEAKQEKRPVPESRTHFSRAGLLEPLGENIPILEFIRQSMRQQMAFDMLYTVPSARLSLVGYDADRPEVQRITPLLIEERGGYTYIIAYSHTRRGQRTYRLDRMEIPGTVPC